MTEREAGPAEAGPVQEHVVIRDKRKIDSSGSPRTASSDPTGSAAAPGAGGADATPVKPAMGQPGPEADDPAAAAANEVLEGTVEAPEPDAETPETPKPLGAELEALRSALDERLKDLQRVTAEYANYRKRVERDRSLVVEQATGSVLGALLPILDDLDRARDHGDLVGPFGAVAEQLSATLAKFGLIAFGEVGDRFDPTRHEAVAHEKKPDVTEPTCSMVMRRGYLLGDRLLRPALVAVADPE
jgi:molecular chaperone GrpE